MDNIVDLEEKINHALEKIRLALIDKKKSPQTPKSSDSGMIEKVKKLEHENEQLRKEFILLREQHGSDLETVDKLVGQLNAILETKNG